MPSRFASILLSPFYAAQLASGAKSFADNPLLGSEALNRRGLHAARVALAAKLAQWRRKRLAHLISAEDQAEFQQNGFILKRDFLPPAEFEALKSEITALKAPAREMLQGDTMTRRIALSPDLLSTLPQTHALLNSPEWDGLMRYVASFDMDPVYYVQSIFSHVREAAPDPQTHLHADTFHPNMKAWLFMQDVAEDEGPFVYVPGSHRVTPRRLAWEKRASLKASNGSDRLSSRGSLRVKPEELAGLGYGAPQSFAVPANTLVVADTYGFHARGPSVRPSSRVEIWAYSRRNPFVPWVGLDPWSMPGLSGRKAQLVWALFDALERIGLSRHAWRDAGSRLPGEVPQPVRRRG